MYDTVAFVNNCVGQHNYRYFVSFLFYTALSTFYLSILTLILLLRLSPWQDYLHILTHPFERSTLFDDTDNKSLSLLSFLPIVSASNGYIASAFSSEKFLFTCIYLIASSVCLAVSLLLGLHTFLVLTNQTTIEYMQRSEMHLFSLIHRF